LSTLFHNTFCIANLSKSIQFVGHVRADAVAIGCKLASNWFDLELQVPSHASDDASVLSVAPPSTSAATGQELDSDLGPLAAALSQSGFNRLALVTEVARVLVVHDDATSQMLQADANEESCGVLDRIVRDGPETVLKQTLSDSQRNRSWLGKLITKALDTVQGTNIFKEAETLLQVEARRIVDKDFGRIKAFVNEPDKALWMARLTQRLLEPYASKVSDMHEQQIKRGV
jgi:hypothetical protein